MIVIDMKWIVIRHKMGCHQNKTPCHLERSERSPLTAERTHAANCGTQHYKIVATSYTSRRLLRNPQESRPAETFTSRGAALFVSLARERWEGETGTQRVRFSGRHRFPNAFLIFLIMVEVTCSGLLFDLDGVLVDSTPAVARVWTRWALSHGFEPDETVRRAHGRPSLATIRDLLPGADHVAENEVVLRGEIEDTEGVVPLPGALELLASLPADRWSIVTSCARELAEVRLKAAGLPIPNRLLTSDDVTRGKPDPEPYLKGAALLGLPATKCVVFEDAPAGIRAGKAAGASVVALQTTSPDEELRAAGADWIISGYNRISVVELNQESRSLELSIHD